MQQIIALARCLGYDGLGGREGSLFPARKPLIQKKQMISRTGEQVRIELHSTRWLCLPSGLAQGGLA